ncbi:MAG TPA: T9SS type A sorting domain-containing protein [Saprospiraceae bacterium]|nr:T9SS type A sorting domain-containing protein [Saprospiraceae bacterium]
MKTTIVGLIPNTPFSAFIGHLFLAGVCLLSSAVQAAVDDWPATSYYSPYDPLQEFITEQETEGINANALACIPSVQISLDQNGQAIVTPGMLVLDPMYPLNMYVVDIMGPLTNLVTCAEIGDELMAVVLELPTQNQCMSTLIVEDKLKPFMSCEDDTIACNVDLLTLDYLSFLDAVDDNCDDNPYVYYEYTITELNCDPDGIAGYVDITYHATDDYGNSNSCDQRIYLEKFDLADVMFPADTMINCDGANTDPEVIGGPTIEGGPIHHFCELIAWKTDNIIPMCSGQTKIIRLWRVMDWCTGEQISDPQEILIIDTVPPEIICPVDITLGTFMLQCSASYTFPTPIVTDICSDDALIDIWFTVSDVPGIFYPGQQVLLDLGPHIITVYARDDCNNTATCQYTVTVIDDDNPVVVCNNLNITLDVNGMAFLYANSSAFIATDNCGIASRAIRRMDDNCDTPGNLVFGPSVKFCCEDVGESVMVIFQAIDFAGNVSICMIQVTVSDKTPPTALCQDACLFLGEDGTVVLLVDSIDNGSFDNCGIVSRQLSDTLFDCSNISSPVVVVLTVSDESGNTASCTALVEVKDTVPPEAECMDITVELNDMGMIVITTDMIDDGSTDNCEIDTVYISQDSFDCGDIGDNEVDLIVIDEVGLADTCTAIVTIEEMPPMVMCMDVTVYLDEMGMVNITPDDVDGVTDDCSMPIREVDPDSFDCSDVGPNVVILTATDDSGNTATCSAIVTVVDSIAPECNAMDLTVQLDADGSVMLAGDALDDGSTDNCDIETININPNTFTCEDTDAPVEVVQTVTDVNGNSSTCTAIVTVEDNIDPICLTQNIVVQLNAAGMATISHNALNNGSSDNCDIESIILSQTQFDCDDVGIVIVTQTVTDVNGNTANCTATVTVEDNIDPTCVTQDITVQLDANGMATISNTAVDDGSSDACGILSIAVTPANFDCDDVGIVIVTQTVTDVNGNTSTCTAEVTVEDNIDPICLTQDITVELGPDGTVTIANDAVDDGSSDNCETITITVDPNTFDCNSEDVVVVVQTVTDENGNSSTCTANVTVLGGDEPIAECIDITVFLDENGVVVISPDDVDGGSSSLCGDIELSVDPFEFDCEDIGDNTVTLTVTDVTGNTATCTAIVTVQDTLAPECLTQDVTVFLDADGNASIEVADVDDGIADNCELESVMVEPSTFDCEGVGIVIVVITATDVNGNVSTCTAEVTVIDDIGPLCLTQDITVTLDGSGNAAITPEQIDNGSSDNCDAITLSVDPSTFTCDDVGENIVVLTVTDDSGNTSTCTAIVTVEDPGGLVALCQNLMVFLDANGQVIVLPEDVDDGSGGGCFAGELTFELSETNFNCTDIGPNLVILTVTDSEGNSATCTAIITVSDNTPPSLTCPPNMTVDCDDPIDIEDLSPFGTPIVSDNCPPVTLMEAIVDNRDDCGQGTIVRTFTATDPSGNSSQCAQTITVMDPDPFDETDIIWPPALVNLGPCSSTDPGPGNQPVIDSGTCTNISVSYSDDVEMTVDNDPMTPCIEITRTWTVIDSCQLEDGTQNGIFTFTQMIILNDNVGPVFTLLNDITVTADSVTCVAFVTLITTATDCGMSTPITNSFNAGGGNASGDYPIGTTIVVFTSTDACGNINSMDVIVTVLDPDPATVMCEKIIRFLDDFEITVLAEEFITFTPGSCTDIDDYQFSYSPTDPLDSSMIFMCPQVGVEPVMIYTFDLDGNPIDTCRGDLDLRDTLDICGDGLIITGEIFGENKAMIGYVPVLISEPSMQTVNTGTNGRYVYRDLIAGSSYEITPFWNVNHKDGVTTLDLVAIQKHLLGIRSLDSPYKLIASDANNSGTISVMDLIEIRRLLLDNIPAYTRNTSWRFVDAHYEFADPQNPWVPAFPESLNFDPLMQHMTQKDFVGVKIGDVNNTVFLAQSETVKVRSEDAMILAIDNRMLHAGELVVIPVSVINYKKLVGYQFSLHFDPNIAVFEGISFPERSFLNEEWFGLGLVDQGLISSLWYESSPRNLPAGEILFSLSLQVTKNVMLSDVLTVYPAMLAPEAYGEDDGQILPVRLEIGGKIADLDFVVFQNVPNPFAAGTVIPVQLPESSTVVLEVYSYDGRLVHKQSNKVDPGYHEFMLTVKDLGQGGIYYYTISTDHFRGTRKMILLE